MTLYVDKISADKRYFVTENPDTVFYNVKTINEELVEELTNALAQDNEGSFIKPIGIYVCMTTMSLNHKISGISFFDLHKDPKKAKQVADALEPKTFGLLFMEAFRTIEKSYNERVDKVKIVKGNPPKQEDPNQPLFF